MLADDVLLDGIKLKVFSCISKSKSGMYIAVEPVAFIPDMPVIQIEIVEYRTGRVLLKIIQLFIFS